MVLDPGHGGGDVGVEGMAGAMEKTITLRLALAIQKELKEHCTLIMTRERDNNPNMVQRAESANRSGADLFISLHTGSASSQSPGSIRIFHLPPDPAGADAAATPLWDHGALPYNRQSALLAQSLAEALTSREIPRKTSVQQADMFMLKPLTMPAILIEAGNLTSPQDALWLMDSGNQQALAKAIARGVRNHIDSFIQTP
ncbi:N-acetylmuramoyl-L-alanine amidase [Desulfobotulus sp. H1]|uniref:N-acetylmuramoyl-L-alanine amidase n=1 Tax=Desulfobotulus pelophilus TaxID=2823377 RepID=A0ABT3NBL3_9BACT|nr:N-acetylmuramoyl-L-alanine amidase [Desulfobotulus pelophilus]